MTKVIQLQYSMESAGSSALRLQRAFCAEGIDSNILSFQSSDNLIDPKIKYLRNRSRIKSKLDKKIQAFYKRKIIKKYGAFSFPVLGTDVSAIEEVKKAEFIYLHWVLGGFQNLSNLEQILKLKKPVIIIMHDMWYLTGGCHHSFTCEKYISGCYNCQIFQGNKKKDLSFIGFNRKKKLFQKYHNLYFVSPSRWLYDCAKKSLITKDKPIFHIPNILDKKIFKPIDKSIARQVLNLDPQEIIIAFGATSIDNPYKGWSYLLDALNKLFAHGLENVSLLIFGGGYNEKTKDTLPFKAIFLGYLNDEYTLPLVYNAADLFVVPSLADNLPTTVLESLACGTAVVGFEVGGIPDMIIHKTNGYLAKYKDSDDLANGIIYCINNKTKGNLLPAFEPKEVIKMHLNLLDYIEKDRKAESL